MKAKEGRKKSVRALVVVGNGKGAAGMYAFIVCMHLLYVCIYCMYKVTSDDGIFCGSFNKTPVFMVSQSFTELCL